MKNVECVNRFEMYRERKCRTENEWEAGNEHSIEWMRMNEWKWMNNDQNEQNEIECRMNVKECMLQRENEWSTNLEILEWNERIKWNEWEEQKMAVSTSIRNERAESRNENVEYTCTQKCTQRHIQYIWEVHPAERTKLHGNGTPRTEMQEQRQNLEPRTPRHAHRPRCRKLQQHASAITKRDVEAEQRMRMCRKWKNEWMRMQRERNESEREEW